MSARVERNVRMGAAASLFQGAWGRLALAVFAAILAGICSAGLITVIGEGIAGISTGEELVWMFFGLCLSTLVFRSGATIGLIRIAQSASFRLRMELSSKLLATPLPKLQQIGKAELHGILTSDIMTVTQALHVLPLVLSDLVLVLVCLAYLAWLSYELFVGLALSLAVGLICYLLAQRIPARHARALRQQMDVVYRNCRNLIEGSKELQLNARRRAYFIGELTQPAAQQFRQLFVKAMTGFTLVNNFGTMLFFVIVGTMLFVRPALQAPQEAALGQYALTLLYLIGPIGSMMSAVPALRQGGISLRKIEQLEGRLIPSGAADAPPQLFGDGKAWRLSLRQVSHEYADADGGTFRLGPVDMDVEQGEIVFIVGGNGSGKTTLAMLLLGLYEPLKGTITLNGIEVGSANREAYRQHFSAVFSDFHLFEDLLDGDSVELANSANAYLAKLAVGHKVRVEDGRFSTINLSSGQRKRLALVSSYLEDRPIYLFDEWAADQDPEFKRVFYTELLPELKRRGKIVLVITHDDAYFDCADRVLKLADGRLLATTAS